jgi:hypothetical protein
LPLPRFHRLSFVALSFLGFAVLAFVFALLAFVVFLKAELFRSGHKVLSRFTIFVDLTQGREESNYTPLSPMIKKVDRSNPNIYI